MSPDVLSANERAEVDRLANQHGSCVVSLTNEGRRRISWRDDYRARAGELIIYTATVREFEIKP